MTGYFETVVHSTLYNVREQCSSYPATDSSSRLLKILHPLQPYMLQVYTLETTPSLKTDELMEK